MTMRTLVTGGAGFIGSHLVDNLLERRSEVTVLDNLTTGKVENLEKALACGAELVEGDILDKEFVEQTLREVSPNIVFHLAAQGEVQRSIEEPAFDATANVVGTINVLEASRRQEVDRFVFASTGGAIYGEGSEIDLPASETTPERPLCPYGLSKLCGEQYLSLYRRMCDFNAVALRFANVYGPRQSPKGESGAVAIFGELLLAGSRPIVFGDGLQTRDFVFIDDAIQAVVAASESEARGPFNIGSGEQVSLLDLLSTMERASSELDEDVRPAQADFRPDFDAPRSGEVRQISIDPSQARKVLDWVPRIELEEGLALTLTDLAKRVD